MVGAGDFDAQAAQAFANLKGARGRRLEHEEDRQGDRLSHRHGELPEIVALRAKHFSKPYPADTIVEVRGLALKELMIEIEAVALVEGEVVD